MQAPSAAAPAAAVAPVVRKPRSLVGEKIIETLIRLCGISAMVFVFSIFFFVFREALPIPARVTVQKFLLSTEWVPTSLGNVRFGIGALILGTLSVTFTAMLIAVPFGLGAAVYVSEFCKGKIKETLKVVIELLAAIPSVVWGFIGLTVMNKFIIWAFGVPVGLNVLNASLLLALMSIPIMVSIGEDALKAVPDSYREAAFAMGATRWQSVYKVMLPAAKNGLLAAVLLGVGRAIGETMAVLMATGHAINNPFIKDGAFNPAFIFESVRTLTATIAAELGEASEHSEHYRVLFLIGIVLFTLTFIVNVTADLIVRGIKKR
jgi:phosphate transport system permease protein